MSTFIAEPGTRLAGRYRLEDRVDASSGWSAWKAIDETLARAVTVLTFAPGFPRVPDVVTAAQAASRLNDPRVTQVFDVSDVEEDWDQAYVVMEWAVGDRLADLLEDGPLEPARAAEMLAQAAEALTYAHAAGVAHLCLTPASLHWSPGGGVKVAGLGIDAALTGTIADDPALADTRGLGMLLYAALTARWPGASWPGLSAAPETDGHPCSPRQVRAGVPAALDEITRQALSAPGDGFGAGLATPAEFATAMARLVPPAVPPPSAPPRLAHTAPTGPVSVTGYPAEPHWGMRNDTAYYQPGNGEARPRRSGHRALTTVVVLLVLAALGGAGWLVHSGAFSGSSGGHRGAQHTAAATTTLTPASAHAFGPNTNGDNNGDNASQAPLAIDGNPHTAWTTDNYATAKFGNFYSGTGLILDMGHPVKVSSLRVQFGPNPGTDVQIYVGNTATGSTPGTGFTKIASQNNVSGAKAFTAQGARAGQFVLIWFTKLGASGGGFQADVFNVSVRGAG